MLRARDVLEDRRRVILPLLRSLRTIGVRIANRHGAPKGAFASEYIPLKNTFSFYSASLLMERLSNPREGRGGKLLEGNKLMWF
jgi:hypothetical protein